MLQHRKATHKPREALQDKADHSLKEIHLQKIDSSEKKPIGKTTAMYATIIGKSTRRLSVIVDV